MEAVSNATVLILLSKLNRIDLLKNKYPRVLIPAEVMEELMAKDMRHSPSRQIIHSHLGNFIHLENPHQKLDILLGQGEQAAISLAHERKLFFLSDDKQARMAAVLYKIEVIGTLGILLWNLQQKYLSNAQCKECIDKLIMGGYYVSPDLYAKIIDLLRI